MEVRAFNAKLNIDKQQIDLSGIVMFIEGAYNSTKTKETKYCSYLYDHKPMPMDTAYSIQYKCDNKEIYKSLQLDGAESMKN